MNNNYVPEIKLSKKQYEALKYLLDNITEFVLFGGGANGGKSWFGCVWLLMMCYKYPKTRWFIGREELKRLRESTLITFFKVCNYYKIPSADYTYNAQDHYIIFKNGSRIDLLDLKYLPGDPLYERYGSIEFTGGWIEEGGEVHFDAYDTLKSRINRHMNDFYGIIGKMLITCNPKKNWIYSVFFKPFKNNELPQNMKFIQSLIKDNDFRERGSIEKLEQITNKAKRERLLYGNWDYEDEPNQLIQFELLDKALDVKSIKGKKCIGVDVARYGNDKSIIALFEGNTLLNIDKYEGLAIDVFADKVKDKIISSHVDANMVGLDSVGLGAGTLDILKRNGYKVKGLNGGEAGIELEDKSFQEYKFKNLRSQMYWILADELRKGEISIQINDDTLFEDLTSIRYEIVGEKMIQIEKKDEIKKRIGRSPDLADAVVYANWMRKDRVKKKALIVSDFTLSF